MITFANPKKQKMAIACESIELTEAGNWESFPEFAERYAEQIGAKIVERISTPDMHIWQIEYEGHVLNFVYNDFPNGVSLEPKSRKGKAAIEKLWQIIEKQSEPSGL
jgi:hypothetical protein